MTFPLPVFGGHRRHVRVSVIWGVTMPVSIGASLNGRGVMVSVFGGHRSEVVGEVVGVPRIAPLHGVSVG